MLDAGEDAGTPIDVGVDAFATATDAGRDAFVATDAGHDAFVPMPDAGQDAGHDAAVSGSCALTHMVISEVRTRGVAGAGDEFVELYNPTSAAIVLDATYTLSVRSSAAATYTPRWAGTGQSVGAHRHFLITGANYTQTPGADAALSSGITDAGSIVLYQGTMAMDAVCFAFDATSTAAIDSTYVCEGTPAMSPHDNSTSAMSNSDRSLERRPGGALGHCMDTGVSASDFVTITPATPLDLASLPTP